MQACVRAGHSHKASRRRLSRAGGRGHASNALRETGCEQPIRRRRGRRFVGARPRHRVIRLPPGLLRTVLRPALAAVFHAGRVERASDDVILHARQILHTATANQHDGVLLQVMSFSGDVSRHLVSVREANPRDLPERRVRLLRCRRVHSGAYAAALWAVAKRGGRTLLVLRAATLADQLLNRRHNARVSWRWCPSVFGGRPHGATLRYSL